MYICGNVKVTREAGMQTRLSIDIPVKSHTFLKKKAAEKRITIREYVIQALAYMEEKEKELPACEDTDQETFRTCLERMHKKHKQLFSNLAKR